MPPLAATVVGGGPSGASGGGGGATVVGGGGGGGGGKAGGLMITESQRRIDALSDALQRMGSTTRDASKYCDSITKRSRHLDSLTSPASDASAMLTQASSHLTATLSIMKDAREKFDTVQDCEPSISRLLRGAKQALETEEASRKKIVGTPAAIVASASSASASSQSGTSKNEKKTKTPKTDLARTGSILAQSFMPTELDAVTEDEDGTGGGEKDASSRKEEEEEPAPPESDDITVTSTATQTLRGAGGLTEQDIYAAADSMEIIRDAHAYFVERHPKWKSSTSALNNLERVHQLGVQSMCTLVHHHFLACGPAVRTKRIAKSTTDASYTIKNAATSRESSSQTRTRLSAALQNRDLMKSVGEYEEYMCLDSRSVRELRSIYECLGSQGAALGETATANAKQEGLLFQNLHSTPAKVVRTEKIGSGCYTKLVKERIKTGFPHLDSYAEARKTVAYSSIDAYYRQLKADRRNALIKQRSTLHGAPSTSSELGEADNAARDAVRVLEHAMVVVAGEKSVYRYVVSPTSSRRSRTEPPPDEDDEEGKNNKVSPQYREAMIACYSAVVASVVDRTMDAIETVFMTDAAANAAAAASPSSVNAGGDGSSGPASSSSSHGVSHGRGVRVAAASAAAGLRILDGVRMLGPSLAKLCDISQSKSAGGGGGGDEHQQSMTVAGSLCISIHRATVKNTARTLENLAKAIQSDPLDGDKHRPRDARVAAISSDVVRAIRLIVPFMSAYKSVTKRRALPWDPKIGEDSGDLDTFVRHLVMKLLSNLQGKALNYTKDIGADAVAKSNLFMINNTFYLLEQLGGTGPANQVDDEIEDGETYKISAGWFKDKVGNIFESEKNKYLKHWEVINKHLTMVDKSELSYQNDRLLSLESGRLLKSRFSGFIEEWEKIYSIHRELTVIDPKLRDMLQHDVRSVFLPRYQKLFDKYSRIQFSKKNMDQYLKYPPQRVDAMIGDLYSTL